MSDSSTRLGLVAEGSRLTVSGEIDAHSAPELKSALDEFPTDTDVDIDMAGVDFIDSSGLRVLLEAHGLYEQADHRMVIVSPSSAVRRLVEISGLHDHLHLA